MNEVEGYRTDPSFLTLSREIADENCILFVGSAVSTAAGVPTWDALENIMRQKAYISGSYSPSRIADCCREVLGTRLFNKLIGNCMKSITVPTQLHRRLSDLPVRFYVTTNPDTLLDRAIEEKVGLDSTRVLSILDDDQWLHIPDNPEGKWVLKIHGCISRTPDNLVITEEDYLAFAENYPRVVQGLSKVIAEKSILFVGYALSDWDVLSALHKVRHVAQRSTGNRYFVGVDLEPPMERFLQSRYGLRVFNLRERAEADHKGQGSEYIVLGFLDTLAKQFEIPTWFSRIITDIGYYEDVGDLMTTTPIAALFPGFDVTARVRLALKIEKEREIQLPLERICDPVLTIGELLSLVRNIGEGGIL